MAKQIYQLDKDLDFALNKANLFFSHEEKMDALHRAQIELFSFYYGNVAGYQNGRPVPRVSYQVTQAVSSALQPFIKSFNYSGLTNGFAVAPTDMVHPTALRTASVREIKIMDDDKVAAKVHSKIAPPTENYPIAEITASGWKLYPALDKFTLKYLSMPQKPVYGLKIVDGIEVYDEATSSDLLWKPVQHNELINRALAILGLNVKDAAVMNTAERNKQAGQ